MYSYQEVARYLALDVKMTWLLWRDVWSRIEKLRLRNVFGLEMDLLKPLMEMEQTGTLVDVEALKVLRAEIEQGELNATAAAYKAAGRKFNVGSQAEKRAPCSRRRVATSSPRCSPPRPRSRRRVRTL